MGLIVIPIFCWGVGMTEGHHDQPTSYEHASLRNNNVMLSHNGLLLTKSSLPLVKTTIQVR